MTGDTKDTGIPIPHDMAGTIEEGTESVRRTIVGGRPLDRRRRKVRIPIGIEKVLCAAAADREFREQLLMARADVLPGTGLEVSPSEAMILGSVSEEALRTMIENIDLKRHKRRRFFRGIAAASLAATTAVGTANCVGGVASAGIDPDLGNADSQPEIVDTEQPMDVGHWSDDILEVVEYEDRLTDLGATDGPPDIIPYDEHKGDMGVQPDGVFPPDLPEITAGVDVKNSADATDAKVIEPTDANEIDVDVQPMPAGIPPVEDVKEPK